MKAVIDFQNYLLIECHLSQLTIEAYISDINQFLSTIKHQDPTKDNVIDFLNQCIDNEYTKRTISRKISALRLYCHYLKVKKRYNAPDITDVFKSNITLNLPKLITKDSLKKILSCEFDYSKTPERDQCIIALLYYSGCRVTEVTKIKRNNIFSDHIIILGKGDKERVVPLANIVKERLNRLIRTQGNPSEWLFPGRKNRHITRQTITSIINQFKLKYKIKERVTPHTLRHMFATTLLERGMDLREVQLLLGHASIRTTQIYTHLDKSKLKRVYNTYHPLS